MPRDTRGRTHCGTPSGSACGRSRGLWWWFLLLGVLWTWFGLFVLSYRVGSLAAVAALVGVAFLFGGLTQLAVASRVQMWRWLFVIGGILGWPLGS
jgi:uncharacterized membrane protein HdeD (DUF308 family)